VEKLAAINTSNEGFAVKRSGGKNMATDLLKNDHSNLRKKSRPSQNRKRKQIKSLNTEYKAPNIIAITNKGLRKERGGLMVVQGKGGKDVFRRKVGQGILDWAPKIIMKRCNRSTGLVRDQTSYIGETSKPAYPLF